MIKSQRTGLKSQAGFTLVELAIVMIIIGLLIGGVLKGQQLITNAQVAATVAQIKSIDAATTSFKDQYNAMPGDMLTPTTRLTNCTAATSPNCAIVGNGDGHVGTASIDFSGVPAGEQLGYWAQLNAAGLLTGINPGAGTAGGWGAYAPASKISGGGFDIGWFAGAALLSTEVGGTAANVATGHYLFMHGSPGAVAAATAADAFLTTNLAARIDTKIDDGQPGTGVVLAGGQAACVAAGVYAESVQGSNCSLFIKFQN